MKEFQRENKLPFFLALSFSIGWQFSWEQTRSGNGSRNPPATTARAGKNNDILQEVSNPEAPLSSHCLTSWFYRYIKEDQNPVKGWNWSFFRPCRGNFILKFPFSSLPSVEQHNHQNPNLRALVPLVTQSFTDLVRKSFQDIWKDFVILPTATPVHFFVSKFQLEII